MTRAELANYAFIAIGANLPGASGSVRTTLDQAVDALRELSAAPLRVSPYYLSEPKDCPPGSPRYYNAVAALKPRPSDTALSLLLQLQAIETRFGRQRSGLRNEARTLDLDLLTFSNENSNTPQLTLPHPRAHQRRFVLEPWIAIANDDWPLQGRTLGEWLRECADPPLIQAI
ncbi:MAG: 2-amino-4-hydroxy-6-hydroxymethyldihydropteridine diphosphokinase [Pseudomonadales bacterium]|jgi:2-amino-4-hydroxy-6-hydroxymethyldihydropteridine diphosphokinase|nr:2-amino-4-hydroxy-6-hydroxymethyldihydropteridine diphosphokinase [Pseudomonadales bacterium]